MSLRPWVHPWALNLQRCLYQQCCFEHTYNTHVDPNLDAKCTNCRTTKNSIAFLRYLCESNMALVLRIQLGPQARLSNRTTYAETSSTQHHSQNLDSQSVYHYACKLMIMHGWSWQTSANHALPRMPTPQLCQAVLIYAATLCRAQPARETTLLRKRRAPDGPGCRLRSPSA